MDLRKLLFGGSNLIISCVLCIVSLLGVQGKDLKVSTNGGDLDLTTLGVDVVWCKSMLYQAKGCSDHNMLLLDEDGASIIHFLIGGFGNSMSLIAVNSTENSDSEATPLVMHCDEFRWFWMSWGAGRIQYGAGRVLGENAILDLEDPTGRQVKKMVLREFNSVNGTLRLGETERERYARVLEDGKFSDGMISETKTSLDNCVDMCSKHDNCGMFSYNPNLGLCAIFDRMTSSFTMTSEEGWKSWKLLYCYP